MKIFIFVMVLFMATICQAGELRQNGLPDYNGNPIYTYTEDDGDSYEIRERGLKDLNGNPIYDIEED